MNAKICNKPFPNCTNNCYSICIIWRQIDFKVDTAIYIFSLLLTSKEWPTSSKPKKIQKPQFLSTLFSNFWYFSISTYVSNGKWLNFGLSPLWKTFLILDHCDEFCNKFLLLERLGLFQALDLKEYYYLWKCRKRVMVDTFHIWCKIDIVSQILKCFPKRDKKDYIFKF